MAISTASYLLIGTGTVDEAATLASVANTAILTGATVDLLGDDTSTGDVELYLILTSTVTAGTIDINFNQQRRLNGGTADYAKVNFENSVVPTNGTQKIPIGRRPCPRYMSANVRNNATGASASVAILAKVTKLS
jgi:hypothetical protein